jgi:hypothetical protein
MLYDQDCGRKTFRQMRDNFRQRFGPAGRSCDDNGACGWCGVIGIAQLMRFLMLFPY